MISRKYKNVLNLDNIQHVDMTDLPTNYLQTHSQMKKEERGLHKIRARNDKIHSDLIELAERNDMKLTYTKKDGKMWLSIGGLGISVCLCNT